ncbi:HemK2/MTQ2 family protein methyltransferase [Paenibacillus sp. NPDC057934]|uniref:HemK2/MTQ2 family protein methyltransferase n=1 Tax=Paenibacillus sp. NPDC057934 TaxID=3346282 RepID=UPI0036DD60B9
MTSPSFIPTSVLAKLATFLERHHLREIIEALYGERLARAPWTLKEMENNLGYEVNELLKLFHMGQNIKNPETLLGEEFFKELFNHNLIIKSTEGWSLGGLHIIPFQGLWLFRDVWVPGEIVDFDQIWFGEDSMYLAKMLPNLRGKLVLDLCTGTGIQGLIMASYGATVVAVDINSRAVAIARMNAAINGLEEFFSVVQGDLYSAVESSKFDLIVANPPFLPVTNLTDVKVLFADGGVDGLEILRKIIREMPSYLNPNGRSIFFAGGFGNEDGPMFAMEANKLAAAHSWTGDILLTTKQDAKIEILKIEEKFPNYRGNLQRSDLESNPNMKFYYSFVMCIEALNETSQGKPGVRCMHCYTTLGQRLKEMRKALK